MLHHHASTGGLRSHGARVVTGGGSRRTLRQRNLIVATEVYQARRFFSERQVVQMLAIRRLAVVAARGSIGRRAARTLTQLVLLPSTELRMRGQVSRAGRLLREHPTIPPYTGRAPDDA